MTEKIPYRVALLITRIQAQDITAIDELWQEIYGEPMDHSRPLEDLATELGLAVTAQYGETMEPPGLQPATPTPEQIKEQASRQLGIVILLLLMLAVFAGLVLLYPSGWLIIGWCFGGIAGLTASLLEPNHQPDKDQDNGNE